MVDEDKPTLTPEEAGAFVAQWAERRKVDVAELSRLLGVDEAEAVSLLRQAKGRVHMQDWLLENRQRTAFKDKLWAWLIVAFVVGGAGGCFVMSYFAPPAASVDAQARQLPPPPIQVSSGITPPEPFRGPGASPFGGPMPPDRDSAAGDRTDPNIEATRLGAQAGAMLGDLTVSIGHRPTNSGAPVIAEPTSPGQPTSSERIIVPTRTFHDLTNQLPTPLPADAVVELDCPAGFFKIRGATTNDYVNAMKIRDRQLINPMVELLTYAINTDTASPHGDAGRDLPIGRIRVHVGKASGSASIRWNRLKPDDLKTYRDPDCPLYHELTGEVMMGIRQLKERIFESPLKQRQPGG